MRIDRSVPLLRHAILFSIVAASTRNPSFDRAPTQSKTQNRKPNIPLVSITIVTGYLGAGKTTLLNHILTSDHGRRIAVIQNEFGQIGIDHELMVHVEEGIYTMENGCICCTVRDDMIEAIEMLMGRSDALDQIVIETTGLASPGGVVMTLLTHPDAGELFTLDGVVALADARHLPLHLERGPEAADQLAYADMILLNKTDLAAPSELEEVEHRIRELNPTATIIRTRHAAADAGWLLDLGGFDPTRLDIASPLTARHEHEKGVTGVAIVEEGAIDLDRFERWVEELLRERHEDIYRMKGILDIAGQPRRYIFQGVHALSSWGYGERWGEGPRKNKFVLIGRDLDAEALTEGFKACRAGS